MKTVEIVTAGRAGWREQAKMTGVVFYDRGEHAPVHDYWQSRQMRRVVRLVPHMSRGKRK